MMMAEHPLWERAQRAYLMLLFEAWGQKEPGVFPYTPRGLAKASGLDLKAWEEIEHVVKPGFTIRESDGAWTFPLMIEVNERQKRIHKKQTEKSKRAAKARWSKPLDATSMANGHACSNGVGHADSISVSNSDSVSVAEPKVKRGRRPTAFADELISRLEAKYPRLDVRLTADNLLNHPKQYVDWDKALHNWCRKSELNGWDRKKTDVSTWGEDDATP